MVLVDMEFTLHLWWFTATEQKHTKKQIRKLVGSILYKWMLEHVRNKKFTVIECQYPFGRVITTFPFCPSASSILSCCKESTKRCFKLQSYLHQKCWDPYLSPSPPIPYPTTIKYSFSFHLMKSTFTTMDGVSKELVKQVIAV